MEKKHSDTTNNSITTANVIARIFVCAQDKDLIRYIDLNMRY